MSKKLNANEAAIAILRLRGEGQTDDKIKKERDDLKDGWKHVKASRKKAGPKKPPGSGSPKTKLGIPASAL